MIPPAAPTAHLVAALASANLDVREEAARELHRRGRALADSVVSDWRKIPELAAIITDRCTVGIAVTPERFERIRCGLGNPQLADIPPDQDAREFEWDIEEDVRLDVLTTCEPGGRDAIARFLAKLGEGIQQVEYIVTDADRATELLHSHFGAQPVYPQTRRGADGTRVNFFLVAAASGGKILIELVENPKKT